MSDWILRYILKEIDGVPNEFQVFPYGEIDIEGEEPAYLDEEGIASVISEFERRGNDAVIDYEHQTMKDVQAPASGWIKRFIDKGQDGLWAAVEWTEKAKEYLKNKEYRYFSPVFWVTKKDRKIWKVENVGLTNYPKVNNLQPIVARMERSYQERQNNINTNKKQEGEAMLEKLKKLLGLADDAGEDKIVDAAEAMIAKNKDLEAAGTIVACKEVLDAIGVSHDADKEAVLAAIKSPTKAETELLALKKDHEDLKKKWAERNADELVAKALGSGRITPAQVEEYGKDMALKDPDNFTRVILSRREFSEVPMQELPGKKDTPIAGKASEKLDRLIEKAMAEDGKLSYNDAFVFVQAKNPEFVRDYHAELGIVQV